MSTLGRERARCVGPTRLGAGWTPNAGVNDDNTRFGTDVSVESVPTTTTSDGTALASGTDVSATSALQTTVGAPVQRASPTINTDASTMMRTPSIGRLAIDVGTEASASATMQLPVADVGATTSTSTYDVVADLRVPLIGLYATALKYGAQSETN